MARLYSPENSPEQNLGILKANSYPGRVLIMGYEGNVAVQAYAIMGRRESSRNRIFVKRNGVVSTEVFDPSKEVGDPELTKYDALRQEGSVHVMSNGKQTTAIIDFLREGKTFEEAMATQMYEPDGPIYTPRISGFIDTDATREPRFGISVIRKVAVSNLAIHELYKDGDFKYEPGIGYGVHTYRENGEPPPSYDEAPFRVPVLASAKDMARLLWENLDPENRVAVAAKIFTPTNQEIHIINGHHL